jgi:lysophospholipase L1-like esterase
MTRMMIRAACLGLVALLTATLSAQTGFPKSGYYVGLGDSVAAGTGALPVTHGYVYQLYDRGVFGRKQEMAFANAALRSARSWELGDDQMPQVLCTEPAQRPTVATLTAGANDFFRGDFDVSASRSGSPRACTCC